MIRPIRSLATSDVHRRTRTIEFTQQLWPQPPKDSKPYFCLINTLCFLDPNDPCKAVWEQKIPEADIKWIWDGRKGLKGPCNVHVEYDEHWGWLLKFYISHQEAMHLWAEMMRFMMPPYRPIEPAYSGKLAEEMQFLEGVL